MYMFILAICVCVCVCVFAAVEFQSLDISGFYRHSIMTLMVKRELKDPGVTSGVLFAP